MGDFSVGYQGYFTLSHPVFDAPHPVPFLHDPDVLSLSGLIPHNAFFFFFFFVLFLPDENTNSELRHLRERQLNGVGASNGEDTSNTALPVAVGPMSVRGPARSISTGSVSPPLRSGGRSPIHFDGGVGAAAAGDGRLNAGDRQVKSPNFVRIFEAFSRSVCIFDVLIMFTS